jgi:iron-sulfur cluster repair protein YtfE (RIC family)
MSNEVIDITPDMTVNEIAQKYPQSLPIFKAFGIDTCCGGGLPLGVVLEKHKLQDAHVVETIIEVVSPN